MSNIFEDWGFIGRSYPRRYTIAGRVIDITCSAILLVPGVLVWGIYWTAEKLGVRFYK